MIKCCRNCGPQLGPSQQNLTRISELQAEFQKMNTNLQELTVSIRKLQVNFLMKSKVREMKLAIQKLMDDVQSDEAKFLNLSEGSKKLILSKPIKNSVNSVDEDLSKDLIREAISFESDELRRLQYGEMFRAVYGESELLDQTEDDY